MVEINCVLLNQQRNNTQRRIDENVVTGQVHMVDQTMHHQGFQSVFVGATLCSSFSTLSRYCKIGSFMHLSACFNLFSNNKTCFMLHVLSVRHRTGPNEEEEHESTDNS